MDSHGDQLIAAGRFPKDDPWFRSRGRDKAPQIHQQNEDLRSRLWLFPPFEGEILAKSIFNVALKTMKALTYSNFFVKNQLLMEHMLPEKKKHGFPPARPSGLKLWNILL